MPRPLRLTALLLALVALTATVVLLGLQVRADSARERQERAALSAAREAATALTSLSHRTTDDDVDRVLAAATGELAQQFRDSRDRLRTLLGSRRSISSGTVLEAGLAELTDDDAVVLLAVNASVTDADSATPRLQRYRITMTMARVGDRWRAEQVRFAGGPDGVLQ